MRKKLTLTLVGTIAALTLGSIAWAAIPAGNGVINGCYDKASGALRVTDTATNTPKGCSNKEAALTWSQQGPKGDPGLPGPKGDKGDPGTSHAYTTVGSGVITATSNFGTKIKELGIPACQLCFNYPGDSYVFSAKLIARADGLNVPPGVVRCQLLVSYANGSSADYAYGTVSSNGSGDVLISTLSMQLSHQMNGGSAAIYCDAAQAALAYDVKITAVQVGGIN